MYKHKPLSPGRSIRILLLHPNRDHGAPIRINLQEATLPENKKECAPYEALSYVWGATTGDKEIECEGSRLLVTKNCLAALRSLRRQDEPRRLWIDAICIDQAGGHDKNHLLKLMGDIYSRAQRVLVWLGHGDDQVAQLFEQLSQPGEASLSAASLRAVLGNARFSRAWTLQELCYGQDVLMIYGGTTVPWKTFVERLDWRKHQDKHIPASLYSPFIKTTSFCGLFQILSDPEILTGKIAE